MAFDFKKEYREFYLPKDRPELITVPPARYIAVRGEGDPNQPEGPYQQAMGILYGVAFTLKMSRKAGREMAGFFDYVVPPLEGFWWQEGREAFDDRDKSAFRWISVLRLPDFVTGEDFCWAVEEASRKKKADFSPAQLLTVEEGLCVQMMHHGPFDTEAESLARMEAFLREQGFGFDLGGDRRHHEIYLSDARRVPPERRRTVIRCPARRL